MVSSSTERRGSAGHGKGPGYRGRWAILALICVSLLAVFTPGQRAQAQVARRKVLILNSYHQGLSWTDNVVRGIESVLDPETQPVELYIEYMDNKRFTPNDTYFEDLATLYRDKFQAALPELIIVADNNAFNFMLRYHDSVFPGVPVIFCGINFFEDSMIAGYEEVMTGVVENVDITDTLDAILELQPDTRRVVVINDATTTGQIYSQLLHELTPQYEERLEFVFYEDPSLPELLTALPEQPENTVILLVLLNRDREGNFYTYEESIDWLYSHTQLPIYGLWDFYLGRGMVGGKLTNGFSQGEAAGQMALQFLQGTSLDQIPIKRTSPNRYIFDYQQLRRLGISLAALPPDTTLINQPLTLLERFGVFFLVAGVGFVILGGVIALQRANIRRRRQVESALRESNRALEETRVSLEQRVADRTRMLERRLTQLDAAARVARDASAIRSVDVLLGTTVELISQRFGFYHAGIFMADEAGEYAVLSAASSEGGRRMLARSHRLRSGFGIVGSVLATGKPRIALDVGEDAQFFNNPDLPATRSEMGLPLTVRGRVIGVLDVQSEEANAFTEADIAILETMAEQLALAIDNARLFEESQRVLSELERLYGRKARKAWEEHLASQPVAYRYTGVQTERVPVEQADETRDLELTERQLAVNVSLRDQVLASIQLQRGPDQPPWTSEERALVEALSTQAALALENARLIDETLRRASREQLTREIADNIRAAVSVEDALRRAMGELHQVLGASELVARLGAAPELLAAQEEH